MRQAVDFARPAISPTRIRGAARVGRGDEALLVCAVPLVCATGR